MATYQTWKDFDEEPDAPPPPAAAPTAIRDTAAIELTAAAIEHLGAPSELVDLLRRKEELETQLRQFAVGEQHPQDERRAKCFPVKVHTKESRIEDRRLRRRDEQLAMLNQRRLERGRRDRVRAESERQARLRWLESLVLARLEAERADQARRRALEQATLTSRRNAEEEEQRQQARHEAECLRRAEALVTARRELQLEEQARLAEERDALVARWAADLKIAVAHARREREQQQIALERSEQLRREAMTRRSASVRAARAEEEALETAKRGMECRLRMLRNARARAEERSFDERLSARGQR
jgi:hypothetical protein